MNNKTYDQQKKGKPRSGGQGLEKILALLSLQEALRNERYEECAALVRTARQAGASRAEVRYVLAPPYQGFRKAVGAKPSGRRRF